ncbi:hypothetical protein CAPTEDRAFT_167868 [Capitella teleta]|uniref:Uncharacterized protein n=1 Tax=Capitella teleta TaxID=283909 RepID=R7VA66_CAPTE|nr:hypothetical protein CAPTEDRAFT_167868 [Capitella teleta]|eukprot:ELU13216.1 hypothetical protein CAPTEDRAFT_167868 [Capitella teleta]
MEEEEEGKGGGERVLCDYCLQTASCNRKGAQEDLLICTDCQAKAHPSCMDYSSDLARRARRSPWQCIDCKTCCLCEDAGDPDAMLFCDACDKGYHMSCHSPVIEDKPTGKWVCSRCCQEIEADAPETTFCGSCVLMFCYRLRTGGCIDSPSVSGSSSWVTDVPNAADWSIDEVAQYFSNIGFIHQSEIFREQEIDGRSLLLLKRSDVLTGLSFKLGPALKIYSHVQQLQLRGQPVQ